MKSQGRVSRVQMLLDTSSIPGLRRKPHFEPPDDVDDPADMTEAEAQLSKSMPATGTTLRRKSSHVHRVLAQKRQMDSPPRLSPAKHPLDRSERSSSDSSLSPQKQNFLGGSPPRRGLSHHGDHVHNHYDPQQSPLRSSPEQRQRTTPATRHLRLRVSREAHSFKFLRKQESLVNLIVSGQYGTPSYNPSQVRMRVAPRGPGSARPNFNDEPIQFDDDANWELMTHLQRHQQRSYNSEYNEMLRARTSPTGSAGLERFGPGIHSVHDSGASNSPAWAEHQSMRSMQMNGALNVRSAAKMQRTLSTGLSRVVKRKPRPLSVLHPPRPLAQIDLAQISPKYKIRQDGFFSPKASSQGSNHRARLLPSLGGADGSDRVGESRVAAPVPGGLCGKQTPRKSGRKFDSPWDQTTSAMNTRRLIGATSSTPRRGAGAGRDLQLEGNVDGKRPSSAIVNIQFGGAQNGGDEDANDTDGDEDMTGVLLTGSAPSTITENASPGRRRAQAAAARRAEAKAKAEARAQAAQEARERAAEQRRLAKIAAAREKELREEEREAAAEAARDRAHKQAAAAAAAETAAKVKMKEAAEEAATMTALAQVPHYTPEQIVERANKKRATDRTRETIEMTEEDHMAWDRREFDRMRQKHFGRASDQIRQLGGWKTVPIFISSTFRDMHGERDVLTREVFPALNERCKRLHINVVPVDLRWGLTAEQCEVEGACQLCLKEIDVGRPFFLGLLGTRYGWIPPTYGITAEDKSFDWIRDLPVTRSITELEILHGFLWPIERPDGSKAPKPAHAFMYFRDPEFLEDVPEHLLPIFLDQDDENRAKSLDLEERVRNYPYARIFEKYPCKYDKDSTDEKPMVKGLDTFRDHVLEDLWSVIKTEYTVPYAKTQWDYRFSERFLHNLFMIEKAQQFEEMCPMPEVIHELTDALQSATDAGTPLLVTGEPGTGMTTALAALTVRYKEQLRTIHGQEKALVFTHFVGNSANFSTDLRRLLLRMCSELDDYFELDIDIPETLPRLKRCLAKCLVKVDDAAKARGEIVYILLDHVERLKIGGGDSAGTGVHSLQRNKKNRGGSASSRNSSSKRRRSFKEKGNNEHMLFEWLPTTLTDISSDNRRTNIHFILSAASSPALLELSAREYPMFALMPLDSSKSTQLIQSSLFLYRKTLTTDQMQGVLSKHMSDNALYVRLFCEELRLHGLYGMAGEGVDMKIKQLPGTTVDLVQASLERIENAVGKQLVTDCLGLICASHHGLIEEELLEMLGSGWDGSETLPRGIWAQLQQNISFIVSKFRGVQSVYKIVHSQFLDGVRRRYLNDPEQRERIYDRLVDFYRSKGDPLGDHSWTGDNHRAFQDIVFYQLRMGSRSLSELHSTLCNLYFIEKRCAIDPSAVYDLADEYEVVLELLRDNTAVVTKAIRRQRFLDMKRRSLDAVLLQKVSVANSEAEAQIQADGSTIRRSNSITISGTLSPAKDTGSKKTRTPAQLLAEAAEAFSKQGKLRRQKRKSESVLKIAEASNAGAITITNSGQQTQAMQQKSREFFGNKHILDMPAFPTDTKDSEGIRGFVEQLLARLTDFLHMVRSQSHVLAVSPSLTFQLALTQPHNSGPDQAAQARVEACMTPSSWVEWVNRPEQNLKLVDRAANSRCNCVAVQGDVAAVGFEDSTIQIITIENLKVRQELNAHDDGVTAVAWARFLLASGDRTGRILVWNSMNFALLYSLDGHSGVVNDLDFSDEGRHLVSVCNDATMRIWSTYAEDFDEIQTVWDRAHVSSLTAVAYFNKSWSGSRGHAPKGNDAKFIASGASSGKIMVWDASAMTLGVDILYRLHRHTREVHGLDFNADGSLLCSGSLDHLVAIWSMHNGELIRILREHVRGITSVKFSSTGEQVFSAGMDNVLNVWQVTDAFRDPEFDGDISTIRTLRGHSDTVSGFVLLEDRQQLLSVSHDRTMKLWNVESGTELDAAGDNSGDGTPTDAIGSSGASPDRTRSDSSNFANLRVALSAGAAGLASPRKTSTSEAGLEYHSDRCSVCALSEDGLTAASGSYDATVKLWRIVPTMQLLGTNREHVDTISALAFSPDGTMLFSGSEDQSIILSQIVYTTSEGNAVVPFGSEIGDADMKFDGAEMFTVRQKHKSDLHATRVVEIIVPSDRTALSADANCTVIIWAFHAGKPGELMAQRDLSLGGPYRVNSKFFDLTPLMRLEPGDRHGLGLGIHLNFDIRQQLVVMATDTGQLQAWSLRGSLTVREGKLPAQVSPKLLAETEAALQVAKADKIKQVTELRRKRTAEGFSPKSEAGSIGLATLSKLKRRARSLTTHVHRYKGLLAPQTPMVCAKIVSPTTDHRPLSSTKRALGVHIQALGAVEAVDDDDDEKADMHAFLSSSSDVVTACDTARNQSLMLIGFDSGRLAMFRIAFKTSTSPVMRRKLVQESGFASATDSEEEGEDGGEDEYEYDYSGGMELKFYLVDYVSKGAFRGHEGPITSVRFNSDGSHCVSTSEDRHLMVWCSDTGMRVGEFVLGGECYSGVLGLDRSTLLCGDATGQLCHLCVKWKAPGSILLEKVLKIEYVKEMQQKAAAEKVQREKEDAERVLSGILSGPTPVLKKARSKAVISPVDEAFSPTRAGGAEVAGGKAHRVGARKSRGETDTQSALGIGVVQLCDWYTSHVAAQLHEMWREAREIQPDGSYEPRIKIVGGHVYDIANLAFEDLPEHYQFENMQAATVACSDIFEQVINGGQFDEEFIHSASVSQHEAWIDRNAAWAPASQLVPFDELSQEDKDKDTVIVLRALRAFQPYMSIAPAASTVRLASQTGMEDMVGEPAEAKGDEDTQEDPTVEINAIGAPVAESLSKSETRLSKKLSDGGGGGKKRKKKKKK